MNTERAARLAAAAALAGQAALAVLNIGGPRWRAIDLDREHNLATWFQAGLLALVALLAVRAFVIEARILTRAGRPRAWATAWLVIAAAFAYLAADEALVIHEGFLTAEVEARLAPASTLRLTLAWLLVFLPVIVGGVAFLLASFAARARMSPRLVVWGAAGLGAWVGALTLEGTAKAFFMPRNLYGLEVILEETLESLGSTALAWAIWGYGGSLMRRFDGPGARAVPALRVPWGRVVTRTLALVIPAAIVGAAMIGNPHVLQRYVGDDLLKAGRLGVRPSNHDSRGPRRMGDDNAAMAKTFRPYDRDQLRLMPPALADWVPEGHLARFVSDLVDDLDLTAIEDTYAEERGYPRTTRG